MRKFLETSERTFLPAQLSHPHNTGTLFLTLISYHTSRLKHFQIWTDYFHSHISPLSHTTHPPDKPWFTNFPHFSRKSIVTITHSRFNHHSLPANLARFIPDISPYCTLHPNTLTMATPNYIFFNSPIYSPRSSPLNKS